MSKIMTVEELAAYLRVTEKTIYRQIKSGKIPAIKVGNLWRLDKDDIDNWLDQKKTNVKARVLVVDDEPSIRFLFQETLEEQGHRVALAEDGSAALSLIKDQSFDLVFLDLRLPGMDGAALFKEIRNIKPDIPITIITGYPDSELMSRVLEQGPFGVMNKPFSESDIIKAVGSYIRISR